MGLVQPIYSTESMIKRAVYFLEEAELEFYGLDQSPVLNLLDSKVPNSDLKAKEKKTLTTIKIYNK
jgi:hypothetical protein